MYWNRLGLMLLMCLLAACGAAQQESGSQGQDNTVKAPHKVTDGGHPAQSPVDPNLIAFTRVSENDNPDVWRKFSRQVFIRHLDTGDERCITCTQVAGGPSLSVHKGAPDFDPSGQYLSLMVEDEDHPLKAVLGDSGPGFFQNLWFTTIAGDKWWKLTSFPQGYQNPDKYNRAPYWGILTPKISPDGSKIAFSQMVEGPDPNVSFRNLLGEDVPNGNPWGVWQLVLGDLVINEGGVFLENLQSMRPGGGDFFEPQDWSPDNRYLLVATDAGHDSPKKLDLLSVEIATGTVMNLTDTDDAFEEFAVYSTNGQRILYMTSCCNWRPDQSFASLLTEYYMMDVDGANRTQITDLNTSGGSSSDISNTTVTSMVWRQDGSVLFEKVTREPRSQQLWKFQLDNP